MSIFFSMDAQSIICMGTSRSIPSCWASSVFPCPLGPANIRTSGLSAGLATCVTNRYISRLQAMDFPTRKYGTRKSFSVFLSLATWEARFEGFFILDTRQR